MQSPDGAYMASDFDYTLSRRTKVYDDVGYKYRSYDRNRKPDNHFVASIKSDHDNDKGYYSDRIYERPICVAERSPMGYHTIDAGETDSHQYRNDTS